MSKEAEYKKVLEEFVNDVNSTGGITRDELGVYHPVADEAWTDIGYTYINACMVIGVEPVINKEFNG